MTSNSVRNLFSNKNTPSHPSLQKYNYSFFTSDSDGIDHRLMSLYCAQEITKGFTLAEYTESHDWEVDLQSFISTVIYRSRLGLGITIAGLTLSRRFQTVSPSNVATTTEDARRVFLAGYMIAAKLMFDDDLSLSWWKRTTEREYDCNDLANLEKQFYQTLAWNVLIDRREFFQCLNDAFAWYETFIEEHTLPSIPFPAYLPAVQERRSRLPVSSLSLELAEGAQMPVIDRGSDVAGLPFPCTAAVQQKPQGLSGMVLQFFASVVA